MDKKYVEVTDKVIGVRGISNGEWIFEFVDGSVKVFKAKEIEPGAFELIEKDGKVWGWCIADTGQVFRYV